MASTELQINIWCNPQGRPSLLLMIQLWNAPRPTPTCTVHDNDDNEFHFVFQCTRCLASADCSAVFSPVTASASISLRIGEAGARLRAFRRYAIQAPLNARMRRINSTCAVSRSACKAQGYCSIAKAFPARKLFPGHKPPDKHPTSQRRSNDCFLDPNEQRHGDVI